MGENEEEKKDYPENKEEEKTEDIKDTKKAFNIIEEAKEVNKEKAKLIEEEKKLMDRKEKLHAEQMLGGTTPAGQEKEETKEITDEDYAKKALSGEIDEKKDE